MSGFKVPGVTLDDPGTWPASPCRIVGDSGFAVRFHGLSKRELFAAMAMQGMLANDKHLTRTTKVAERLGLDDDESIATQAREIADALLAELAKPQEGSAS